MSYMRNMSGVVQGVLSNPKSNLVKAVGPLGGYRLTSRLMRMHPRILMFHRFAQQNGGGRLGRDLFERQLMELKKGGLNVVPLSTVVGAIRGEIPMQKNMVALTIDDGYADFYQYAYPVLKQYDVPATLYVTTGFVDREIWLWPDRITYILANTRLRSYLFSAPKSKVAYSLSDEKPYGHLWQNLVGYCLALPDEEKNLFLDTLASELEVDVPKIPVDEFAAVTWDQLKEMVANGIEPGAHTVTHPAMSKVPPKNLVYEIEGCKKRLENQLGVTVTSFCYPNGQPDDYNPQVMQAVEAAGFKCATVAFADDAPYRGIYELRRYAVGEEMFQFMKAIYGVEALGNRLKSMFR